MKEKISKICDQIFSIGMLLALFVAFLLFVGFIVGIFIGHDAAATLTTFLYKTLLPNTYIMAVCVCLVGIIGMYLRGEKAMMMSKKPKTSAK